MLKIEIDSGSGFCFGVTTAIKKAEEELTMGKTLYCLGDIVHNGMEVERLHDRGLVTINHEELKHQLQKRIKRQFETQYQSPLPLGGAGGGVQLVIFGKNGHAEVLGLVGQTNNQAIVVESLDDVKRLDLTRDIYLYSQTTKSLDEFRRIIEYIQSHISPSATFQSFDTICRQVANRMPNIASFAARHDLILFVSGRKSSNGKVLFHECERVNPNSYHIESAVEIDPSWLKGINTVGICGATSTPKWLMEECRDAILRMVSK